MAKHEVKRCSDPDDPNRCQAQKRDSDQCMNLSMLGSKYCPVHGGNQGLIAQKKEDLFNYRLTKFKERIQDFATNPNIKNLREEIGVTRLMLESLINECKNANDLLMHSSKISGLIRDISSLVNSSHKLESSMGVLLDKMSAVQLSQEIVTIISDSMAKNFEAVLAFVPKDSHDKVIEILECDLVDQIIEGMGIALEHAGSETSA